jgi:hypothetical protein
MAKDDPEPGIHVRRLLRTADRRALATILADGAPYASLVLLALDLDATPSCCFPTSPSTARTLPASPGCRCSWMGPPARPTL